MVSLGVCRGGVMGCLALGFWRFYVLSLLFALLVDFLLGFKRLIYLVDAFVVRRWAWPVIDTTDY